MAKYATLHIYVEEQGYIRKAMIEVNNGIVVNIEPLLYEIEDTIWVQEGILLCNSMPPSSVNKLNELSFSDIKKLCCDTTMKAYCFSSVILGKKDDEIQHRQLL